MQLQSSDLSTCAFWGWNRTSPVIRESSALFAVKFIWLTKAYTSRASGASKLLETVSQGKEHPNRKTFALQVGLGLRLIALPIKDNGSVQKPQLMNRPNPPLLQLTRHLLVPFPDYYNKRGQVTFAAGWYRRTKNWLYDRLLCRLCALRHEREE